MAICNQTLGGIMLDCSASVGGIKEVYIVDYNAVSSVTDEDGIITEITMSGDVKFKQYQFRKETGSMTSTLNADEKTGVNYVTTELSLVFTKMENAKRIEMSALAVGQLAVIVKDSNGKYWYLGKEDYVSSSAGGATTGTAKTDQNAYTLTLKDESSTYPFEVSEECVKNVI